MTRPDEPRRPNPLERRRARIAEEIRRNREGNHRVPTWVMAVAVIVLLGAWIGLIVLS